MPNFYTVYNLKQDIDSNLHSGGVSELQNFYNTLDKGRRAMIGKVRPEELIRKTYLEQALYPNVERYAVPEDMKYDDVIELNLLAGYRNVDSLNHPLMSVYRRRFGQKRDGSRNVINIGYENGIKYARIFRPRGQSYGNEQGQGAQYVWIHNCDSLVDNGTWNVGGNVVDLKLDKLNHVIGTGSLSFDINNSSTTGFLENFTLETFNLADLLQRGAVFTWMDIPLPKNLTSVKLTLGSNTSNLLTDLYESTVNQPHDNNEFTTGWNLLKWMLNNLTTVGLPNPSALAYVRFDFTTTGQAIPNCHIDNIISRLGSVYEMTYNSSYCFMDSITNAIKKIPTSDNDIIIAEEDTYMLLMMESTLAAQKEIYGSAGGAKSDVYDVGGDLKEAYKKYNKDHKSEGLRIEDSTYIFGNYMEGNYTDDPLWGRDQNDNVQTPNQP